MSRSVFTYLKWNEAFWNYFFNETYSNPIIYIDENIIEKISQAEGLEKEEFLSACVFNENEVRQFLSDWRNVTGKQFNSNSRRLNEWSSLVLQMTTAPNDQVAIYDNVGRVKKMIPSFFGFICVIMYAACKGGTTHPKIKKIIQNLTGLELSKVGELIHPLFEKLHEQYPSFDHDRRLNDGKLKNISKIKYHTVLKPEEREDFIDFLEINNLEWKYESFEEYCDEILIPLLIKDDKNYIVDLLKKEEFHPYFKEIMTRELNYGKEKSEKENKKLNGVIGYYFELEFDLGEPIFNMIIHPYSERQIKITLEGKVLELTLDEESNILKNVPLILPNVESENCYEIKNIGSSDGNKIRELIFEDKTNANKEIFVQVKELQAGKKYIKFIPDNEHKLIKKIDEDSEWIKITDFKVSGYKIYETPHNLTKNYIDSQKVTRTKKRTVGWSYALHGIGSWFSIYLKDKEKQKIYWWADNTSSKMEEIHLIHKENGKSYFRLPKTNEELLSGRIYVISDENFDSPDFYSGRIKHFFKWKGEKMLFQYNGWGEVVDISNHNMDLSISQEVIQRVILQNVNDDPTKSSFILLNLLNDCADEHGCIKSHEMSAILKFVLDFHNLNDSSPARKIILKALKRLGLMISFKDSHKGYINQLQKPFIEKTVYSLDALNNISLIKGVFDEGILKELKVQGGDFKFKRPYEDTNSPIEYNCLPDIVLINPDNNLDSFFNDWEVIQYPIGFQLMKSIRPMNEFYDYFQIKRRKDRVYNEPKELPPCIELNDRKRYVLYTMQNGEIYAHTTYVKNGETLPIPISLAKLFCRNQKKEPICLMEKVDKKLNNSKITFLKRYGNSDLLDMSLCDLSLGLPTDKLIFLVSMEGGSPKGLFVYGNTYSTGMKSNDSSGLLKEVIDKLSSNRCQNLISSTAVSITEKSKNYSLFQYGRRHYNWVLKNGDRVILFSKNLQGKQVLFYSQPGENIFKRVENPNKERNAKKNDFQFLIEVFATIINNQNKLLILNDEVWQKDMPDFEQLKEIEI